MYSYFASKEDLFLAIVNRGYTLLETALKEVNHEDGNCFDVIERLFKVTRNYAENYPEMNQIYLDLSTQGLTDISDKLSIQMETITADFYMDILERAQKEGMINPDIDKRLVSFYIDNLLVMFQYSFTSNYYKERMKVFIGDKGLENEGRIIEEMMKFIRKALSK